MTQAAQCTIVHEQREIHEINEYDLCQKRNIEVKILAHRPGLGSTDVIERLVKTADK